MRRKELYQLTNLPWASIDRFWYGHVIRDFLITAQLFFKLNYGFVLP